jgi:aminobenzoyl-glutamate transport protein
MLILVGILRHSALHAGYVVVVPLGAVIYYAAGRHPLAGIAAANAGVAGGFSASFLPSALDAVLQGFTQQAAQIINPAVTVNILSNFYFTAASAILILLLGWYITDRVIEPRLSKTPLNESIEEQDDMGHIEPAERKGFFLASAFVLAALIGLILVSLPSDSPLRGPEGSLTSFKAPLMQSIVPLIFIIFFIPGVVYGYYIGKFKKTKDVIDAMTKAMNGMSYYIVIAFFAALFIDAFAKSNIGALIALKGADLFKTMNIPAMVTVIGIVFMTGFINMFVGSASAKWALLAPVYVPMLMQLGISPELTQAAYRIGDSSTNIITPLSPYLPLFVVFAQRYVKSTGIGTIISMMFPYAITFIVAWSLFLLTFWFLGIPLGFEAAYLYP